MWANGGCADRRFSGPADSNGHQLCAPSTPALLNRLTHAASAQVTCPCLLLSPGWSLLADRWSCFHPTTRKCAVYRCQAGASQVGWPRTRLCISSSSMLVGSAGVETCYSTLPLVLLQHQQLAAPNMLLAVRTLHYCCIQHHVPYTQLICVLL